VLVAALGCQAEHAAPRALGEADAKATPSAEAWDAFFLQGSKIGYGHTTVIAADRDGEKLVEVEALNHLEIARFGQRTVQELKIRSLERLDGRVLEFQTEIAFGPSPTTVRGHVAGGQMILETNTQGSRQRATIPWSDEIGGFQAVEQSLERKPLVAGEKRSLKMLMPVVNQVALVDLAAQELEPTSVMGVRTRLLRIESVARLPDGNAIASTIWTDERGATIKTRVESLEQESFRTSRAVAVAEAPPGGFDLGIDLIVKIVPPLANPRATREVRYRVELANADPAQVFAIGATQTVRSLDDHSAEVTVRSLRPADLAPSDPPVPEVDQQYTVGNSVLQIDDPRVRQMAREAAAGADNPRDIALALERYVYRAVTKKDFSQAFATAAEVATSREGDCTEHAVLLAALARACKIPSRVAIGLVYVEGADGFGYHMWTEVYLNGQWIPLDAVTGAGGTSAAYLKLSDSSLAGPSAYSSFLPVAQVIGQLKVSVLESH
jgi:hypothetical protein